MPDTSLPDLPGPVRILSDLHLGHDMSVIRSAGELRPLIEGMGTVIFNGDTVEARSRLFSARAFDLLDGLLGIGESAGVRMEFLNGNHDPDSWPHDYLDLAGGSVFLTHGHALLRLVSPWSNKMRDYRPELERIHATWPETQRHTLDGRMDLARKLSLAMPPSEVRQEGRSMRDLAGLFLREIWPPRRPWAVLKVWATLPRLASAFVSELRPSARVMLFGHTHRPSVWKRDGRLLVNTGAFVTFTRPLCVDIQDGTTSVRRLDFHEGAWHPGKTVAVES